MFKRVFNSFGYIALLVVIVWFGYIKQSPETNAQDRPSTFGDLLREANWDDTAIYFSEPVFNKTSIYPPVDQIYISSVEDDYVCLSVLTTGTTSMFCTPFSNIVGIQVFAG